MHLLNIVVNGGIAAAHWRQLLEVRVGGGDALVDTAVEVSLSLRVFCNLANWDFNAANSSAVGGGADAVAAAATGEGVGGGAGGKREERGRSESESSI